jgi:glycosyl transferase family 87
LRWIAELIASVASARLPIFYLIVHFNDVALARGKEDVVRVVSRVVDGSLAWLTAKRVFIYALALAVMTNIVVVALYIHVPSFAETPGADFVQFYSAALLSRSHPDKLYDPETQKEIQRQFSPGARRGVYWPYLHAPFFTILLIPLREFSYVGAYWVWTSFTIFLSCLSVALVIQQEPTRRPSLRVGLAVIYAAPVLYWLISTGQTTAVALFVWSMAFVLIKQKRLFWSGFVLGFLAYRAQYLVVVLPLLVFRKMWAGVLGVATSGVLLIVVGGMMFSFSSYGTYIQSVAEQSQRIVTLAQPLSHYVTLFGFFRALLPHYWAIGATILTSLLVSFWLWRTWRQVEPLESSAFDLQWAMLMTATILVMHHGFVYDLILFAVPVLLLYSYNSELSPYYKLSLLLLYFIPYILLIFSSGLPFNPIQPLLMILCFEVYRVYSKDHVQFSTETTREKRN